MPNVIFDSTQGLDFEWDYPDPPEISYRFLRLQHAFEDTLILTEQLAEIAREDIQQHFLTETDPQGKAWEPLVEPAENQVEFCVLAKICITLPFRTQLLVMRGMFILRQTYCRHIGYTMSSLAVVLKEYHGAHSSDYLRRQSLIWK